MEQQQLHNPYGPLQDEVTRLLHTPRPHCKGFFADLPPEERDNYVIPPLSEDNDVPEEHDWRTVAAPLPRQGTTEGRQIRGRSHSSGGRVLHGESGELHPEGALEAENPANLAREERKCFGPIGAARDKRGSQPQHQQPQHQQPQHQQPQHQQPQHQQQQHQQPQHQQPLLEWSGIPRGQNLF
ncbi:uncharacterized protein LOC142557640 [Dermacentor variabilis]|uniref:uncharacterized protein LOC142557640 n=1 Tax=Dermacentor variabilis TaxID=34621 RepID=UPI003F5C40C8